MEQEQTIAEMKKAILSEKLPPVEKQGYIAIMNRARCCLILIIAEQKKNGHMMHMAEL